MERSYLIKLKDILKCNLILIILIILVVISFIRSNHKVNNNILKEKTIVGTVVSYSLKEETLSLVVSSEQKIKCNYYNDDVKVNLGDVVRISGEIKEVKNNTIFNNFNYKKYLKYKNINFIMNIDKISVIKKNTNFFYGIKNKVYSKIDRYKSSSYLRTFIVGEKDYIEDDIYDTYKNNGIVHLFCISGTHINLLVAIIILFLKKLNLNKHIIFLIIVVFLIFYMFLTNYGASVLRSGLFYILLSLKKARNFNYSLKDVLYLTVIILLLFKPTLIYDVGFLYSISISYGLILSSKLIKGSYLKKSFLISVIAFLISLPITINTNYSINLLSIVYNIVFVPLVTFVVTPLAFLTFFLPFFDSLFLMVLKLIENLSLYLNQYSINIVIPRIPSLFIIIYYIILYFVLIKKVKIYYLILIIIFLKIIPVIDTNFYVYYLDVGQGDSSLIKYRNKLILLDTGGVRSFNSKKYYVSDNIITFIKSIGFNHLDYLILTHGDYDHMGDAINIVSHLDVKKVIFNCGKFNDLETELVNVLKEKKIKYYSCINGLHMNNHKLKFLNTGIYDDENNNSFVIYLNYNDYKFLFMGDAGVERERDILKKYSLDNIDFLKVGHHGSNTSSSEEFIKSINPKYSLISVGKNNRYGHPKEEVLEVLKNSKIYRTDLDGSIEIKLNKSNYKIRTCSP